MPHIKLAPKDRLLLANQYLLLKAIDPEQAEDYEEAIKILKHGFELEYDKLPPGIYEGALGFSACSEVYDILWMYRRLHDSYELLDDKSGIGEKEVRFPGFDGNNESRHLSYAEFLNSRGEFEESPPQNSHMPSIEIYRRMLAEYEDMKGKHPLGAEDIRRILDARTHPEHRNSQGDASRAR